MLAKLHVEDANSMTPPDPDVDQKETIWWWRPEFTLISPLFPWTSGTFTLCPLWVCPLPFQTQREVKIADFVTSLKMSCGQVNFGPDVMQSGFGVNFLFWSGEFQENCRRISQRILMTNFDSEFFGLVFPGLQATQKIHAQNSRPELSAFLSNLTFLNPLDGRNRAIQIENR